jgi:aspartate aminotransferase
MKLISDQIEQQLQHGSFIRRMFEAGTALKKEFGEDAICDFSLGNPDLPAPPVVAQSLQRIRHSASQPFAFGYMSNAGFLRVREKLAAYLSHEQGVPLSGDDVLLSCGAAGALNVLFHTILEPGEEVLALAPYFVEYGFYAGNHGGVLRTVDTVPGYFTPDMDALEKAVTARTRALIINSPNNPTGQVYSAQEMQSITDLLGRKSAAFGKPIYLVADEPYRFLTYDGTCVPAILPLYPYAVLASSFSKNLSLAGERIGYLALSPHLENRAQLMAGFSFSNRVLGFVNPPIIGQYLVEDALGAQVDASVYARRRDVMAGVLAEAGYEFLLPKGAFYFFPKAPGGDDLAFVNGPLLREKILGVPGSGFAGPGYFRLAFCVDETIIRRAAPGLKRALEKA